MKAQQRTYSLYLDSSSQVFGPSEGFIKPKDFQQLLQSNRTKLSSETITILTFQVVHQAPVKLLSQYLDILATSVWSGNPSKLSEIKEKGGQSKICGRIFKRGEIVWTCKSCGLDPTCVQCDDCFKKSDHTGHEVFFHKTDGGGGCCDCGDVEAWQESGTCCDHGSRVKEGSSEDDPLSSLPEHLVVGTRATADGVILCMMDYVIQSVNGYEQPLENPFNKLKSGTLLSLRIFNDDFHTYDEVTAALKSCRVTDGNSRNLTKLVDKLGFAKVATITNTIAETQWYWDRLRTGLNLLVAMVPESIVMLEQSMVNGILWLQDFSNFHDGLRRVVSSAFMSLVRDIPKPVCINIVDIQRLLGTEVESAFALDPSGLSMLFESNLEKFPLRIPVVEARTPGDHIPAIGISNEDIESLGQDVFIKHKEIFCFMGIFIASSHFLIKPLQVAVGDFFTSQLRDDVFKKAYAQVLTMLYPMIYKQYCLGLGTSSTSILRTTCQVFTTNSLVQLMSTHGASQRVYTEELSPVCISNILLKSALLAARLGGVANSVCRPGDKKRYGNNPTMLHHCFRQSLRDFGYSMTAPDHVLSCLVGETNADTINLWLELCEELSGIDSWKCKRSGAHVLREDNSWLPALEICMELESVSNDFLEVAFMPKTPDIYMNRARQKAALDSLVLQTLYVLEKKSDQERNDRALAVSLGYMSIHDPVEKFLAKCFSIAAAGGLQFSFTVYNLMKGIVFCTKTALRALSFEAQVKAGIWVRNGTNLLNTIHNYSYPPVSSMMRNIDIHIIQLALLSYPDKDEFINAARFNFEIATSAHGDLNIIPFSQSAAFEENVSFSLAADLLKVLIHASTMIPVDFVSNHGESLMQALKTEIIHMVLRGSKTRGQLESVRSFMECPSDLVSESLLQSVIEELCDTAPGDGTEPSKLILKPIYVFGYDPEHINASEKAHQGSFEYVKELRKNMRRCVADGRYPSVPSTAWPVVSRSWMVKPHAAFAMTNSYLYSKSFVNFMSFLVKASLPGLDKVQALKPGSQAIISRVIHLLTLQLHWLPSIVESVKKETLSDRFLHHFEEVLNFESSLSSEHDSMIQLLTLLCDVFVNGYLSAESYYHEGLEFLLIEYGKLSSYLRTVLYPQRGIVLSGLQSTSELSIPPISEGLKRRRDEAASKAMESVRKRAAKFFEANLMALPKALADSLSIESKSCEGSAVDMVTDEDSTANKVHCILCREPGTSSHPCGFLSLIQASSAVASALSVEKYLCDIPSSKETKVTINEGTLANINCLNILASVYRVVSRRGIGVMSSPNEKSEVLSVLDFGDHVRVRRRLNDSKWVEIEAPCVGWCAMYASNEFSESGASREGSLIDASLNTQASSDTDRRDAAIRAIGMAWRSGRYGAALSGMRGVEQPDQIDLPTDVTPLLFPVKELMFNKFGAHKPHVSSCGHAMHFSCYDDFFSASLTKDWNPFFEQIIPSDTNFRCPMCNSVGNAILPDITVDSEKSESENESKHEIQIASNAPDVDDVKDDLFVSNHIDSGCQMLSSDERNRISIFSELTYSLTQISSPLIKSFGSDKSAKGKNNDLENLRNLQNFWTAAAHTLLQATCFNRWNPEIEDTRSSFESLGSQDLWLVSRLVKLGKAMMLLFDGSLYARVVLLGLQKLIYGVEHQDQVEFRSQLSVPTIDITKPVVLSDAKKLLSRLPCATVPASTYSRISADVTLRLTSDESLEPEALWNFFDQPLLCHDLNTIAVSVLSNTKNSRHATIEALRIVCVSRLIQILIEPCCSFEYLSSQAPDKTLKAHYSRKDVFIFSDAVRTIREICALPFHDAAGSTTEILLNVELACCTVVIDSFIAFMEFCFNLLQCWSHAAENNCLNNTFDVSSGTHASAFINLDDVIVSHYSQYRHLNALLRTFRLPESIQELLLSVIPRETLSASQSTMPSLVRNWTSDFRRHHADLMVPISDLSQYWIPRYSKSATNAQASSSAGCDPDTKTASTLNAADDLVDLQAKSSNSDIDLVFEGIVGPVFDHPSEADDDDDCASEDSDTRQRMMAIIEGNSKKSGWALCGIDPAYDNIDYCSSSEVPLVYPYVGSISGTHAIYDNFGKMLKFGFCDLSAFGVGHRHKGHFIKLPELYTELYQEYKLNDSIGGVEVRRTTAICLACGQVLQAGNRASKGGTLLSPGECTLHAYSCGAGNSAFFLIEDCKCLLVSGASQLSYPSIYATADGETADVRRSTKPLYLNKSRLQKLEALYFKQKIESEVCRKRSTATQVIILNYY